VGGGNYRLAPVQTVGATLYWVKQSLRTSWVQLYASAERSSDYRAPLFRPYLTSERFRDEAEGGAWTGLMLIHQREDLMRAALVGVASLLRGSLDDLRAFGCYPASVPIAGGGAQNAARRGLLAQTLGLPLHEASTSWLTSPGVTLIAASHAT
jgi:sugar (pentulose or hexulose) kinase